MNQAGDPGLPMPRTVLASLPPVRAEDGGSSTPGSEAPSSRFPTLTQRIRSLQPPDVARQALSELGLLARELGTLPKLLEGAGLARTHQSTYFEATVDYLALAQQAWGAIGEERLEQTGADPEYRQRAISVARRITQLQQEARAASSNSAFTLPRRSRLYWRRRTHLVGKGLKIWQDRLASPHNSTDLGQGLFLLRGFIGLAAAPSLWLGLLDFLVGAVFAVLSLFWVSLLVLLVGALLSGPSGVAASFAIGTAATALVWLLVLALFARGPVPLGVLLGAAVFSPTSTTRNGGAGSRLLATILRIWWLGIGLVSFPALLASLLLGGLIVRTQMTATSGVLHSVHQGVALSASALALGIAVPAAVCLTLSLLLAVPVLVVTSVRAAADMAGSPSWVPMARAYAVKPALLIDAMLTGLLVIAVWIATTAAGLQHVILVAVSQPFGDPHIATLSVSLRGVVVFLALALPYFTLIELPYRSGLRTWKRGWLADLQARRADVESHIRRLSITDPRTGMQDTSEQNLRSMQYDLVLLQFYQSKIDETQKIRSSPVAQRRQYLLALVIILIAALILDTGTAVLVHNISLVAA